MLLSKSSSFTIDRGRDCTKVALRVGDTVMMLRDGVLTCEMHAPESEGSIELDDALFDCPDMLKYGVSFPFAHTTCVQGVDYLALCVTSVASGEAGAILACGRTGVLLTASMPLSVAAILFRDARSAFNYLFEIYAQDVREYETIQ
jgi:hypothetical protein